MQDAVELADLLLAPGAMAGGRVDLAPLRAAEPAMLARKHEHMEGKRDFREREDMRRPEPGSETSPVIASLAELATSWKWRLATPLLLGAANAFYAFDERFGGGAGSTPESPIYPQVAAHLAPVEAEKAAEEKGRR